MWLPSKPPGNLKQAFRLDVNAMSGKWKTRMGEIHVRERERVRVSERVSVLVSELYVLFGVTHLQYHKLFPEVPYITIHSRV